jgi:uracil-DNA glycosylase family 4
MPRCALCPGVNPCIPPDGHVKSKVWFIGEAPGPKEQQNAVKHPPGIPFIGPTGEEVNRHYLPLAKLWRNSVFIDNAISCFPVSAGGKLDPNRKKDQELLDCCVTHHLYPLIEKYQPEVLVPMGAFACRALCPEVDLERQHGFPVETGWGIPAFPMYHPALGLHEPKKMLHIRTDWMRLGRYLKGTLQIPTDDYPQPDYAEVEDVSEIYSLDPTEPLAFDTESGRLGDPFCLTYSQLPGSGRLLRAHRADHLSAFAAVTKNWRAPLLVHNWLYDALVCDALGLSLPTRRIVDTMLRVYHLGNLPQGLKALAWRELGMVMQDFEDVVRPHSTPLVLDYYRKLQSFTWEKPEGSLLRQEDGSWKVYQPQSLNTRLKRFFTDYAKNPAKDPFSMWETWKDGPERIEETVGEIWPGLDIKHVPFEETLYYACRDADALIRLWPIIQRMKHNVRRVPQERWREVA